jgi:hypothetical protein
VWTVKKHVRPRAPVCCYSHLRPAHLIDFFAVLNLFIKPMSSWKAILFILRKLRKSMKSKKDACKEIVGALGSDSITKRINSLLASVIWRRHEETWREVSQVFLTSALAGGEWSASRPGRFTPGKESWYPSIRGLSGPQNQSRRGGDEKNISPTGTRTPTPWPSSPVASRYIDWTIPAPPSCRQRHT